MRRKKFVVIATLIAVTSFCNAQTMQMPTYRPPATAAPHNNSSSYSSYYMPPAEISKDLRFIIALKNDSTFEFFTKINVDSKNNFIEVKSKKHIKVIKPSDTKYISTIYYDGRMLIGMPADTCWLFKIRFGKLALYSFLAEDDLKYAVAFQQGNGPYYPLTAPISCLI